MVSCFGPIVLGKHPADDVFVDIDAKGSRDLLGDTGTADPRIAALERDDRVDEFLMMALLGRDVDDLSTKKATGICVS
jgi:hypothetical protein